MVTKKNLIRANRYRMYVQQGSEEDATGRDNFIVITVKQKRGMGHWIV